MFGCLYVYVHTEAVPTFPDGAIPASLDVSLYRYHYCEDSYDSPWAHLTLFFICGPLPPPEAFSRGCFAGARARLGRSGRRCGSARAAPHALARGLDVGIYDGYLSNLRAFLPSQRYEEIFGRDFFGGAFSDVRSPGSVAPTCRRRRRREDLCGRP